jgi:hypothetical protein
VKSLQALAREHTEEALLDRGYGRPVQTQQVRVIRSFSDLTDEELRMLEASALAEVDSPAALGP